MKEITQGHTARLKVQKGIDIACDAVRPTLGAVGMTAMIEYPGLDAIECDDGVTILRNIELPDHYENMGVQMLKKAGMRTSSEGRDGTATTTVLTQALVHEAMKEVQNDSSRIREVRERMAKGLTQITEELKKQARPVLPEEIEQVAAISSLDTEVSSLIADVIKEVGVHGVVTVEKGAQLGYSKEVVKGMRFNRGIISPYFINDRENQQTVLEDAYIILADRKISTNEQILNILNSIGTGKDILFIADDVDSVALGTLAHNAVNKLANIACVRNPYTASPARDFLFDLAALTGATVISEEMGMKLDKADVKLCGRAEKVIITRDNTTIIGGVHSDSLTERIESLKHEIESTTSEYQKSLLSDRLAALTGGIGVIRVGAYTDTEFNAKKYKFDNAIAATQAALEEGIVQGGGVALAFIPSPDPIFDKVLIAPIKQMAINAGVDWYKVVNHVLTTEEGMNFKTLEYGDMYAMGIVDPVKVTRIALESAVAVASSLIGMETAVIIKEEPKK